MASTCWPWYAVTIGPVASKKIHWVPSSGVLPPHQASLRVNVAPVCASYVASFQAPVPLGSLSRVVPAT